MRSANIEPEALDGLLIGQAIRQFAFDDPAVQAIGNTLRHSLKQSAAFASLFEKGFFPWPLHASADDLARILYPATRIVRDEEQKMGDPPEKVMLAAKTIAAVFSQIVGFLLTKELLAHDEQNKEFNRWGRPGLTIDVETSDLRDFSGSVLRRYNRATPAEVLSWARQLHKLDYPTSFWLRDLPPARCRPSDPNIHQGLLEPRA
jgi:hypothetical protein